MENIHENAYSSRKNMDNLIPVSSILDSWRDTILKRDIQETSKKIASGFPEIDRITNGFDTPCLTTVIGRPGMGKTSFALDLALNIGLNSNKTAVIFSYEMGKEGILMRLLTKLSSVSYHDIKKGKLSYAEWKRVSDAVLVLQKANIYIDDSPNHSVEEIKDICRQIDNPGIVCVDYLQLASPQMDASGQPSKVQHYTEIANVMKNIAEQISAPVVCLSQISREIESREDKRPILSDVPPGIREVSDVIIALYRDSYYNRSGSYYSAEAIILKNNSGATGTAHIRWDPWSVAFRSTAQITEE